MGSRAVFTGAEILAPPPHRGSIPGPSCPSESTDLAIQAHGVEVTHCVFLTSALQIGEWPVSQLACITPEARWIRV